MKQPQGFGRIAEREQGLKRRLTSGQMSMIAIGFAGPSVIISDAIGGLITLLLMGCLAEMTVAHSTSGSFGAYAEHYIGPLAGFLVRYAYWSCVVLAVGTEVTAVAEYMKFWFPAVPGWQWVCLFSAALIFINAMSVKAFGTIEYWFSTIKISAIVAFIILGAYVAVSYTHLDVYKRQPFHHVADDGLVREQLEVLEHHAGLHAHPLHLVARELFAGFELDPLGADLERAAVGHLQQVDAAQQGALAAAGRADQGGDAAFGDGHVDLLEHQVAAKGFLDLFQADHRFFSENTACWPKRRSRRTWAADSTELNTR